MTVEGDLLRGRDGYLFLDERGQRWWILVVERSRGQGAGPDEAAPQGRAPRATAAPTTAQIVACRRPEEEETPELRVLVEDVGKSEAEEAFRLARPVSFEEAVSLAERLERLERLEQLEGREGLEPQG